MISIPNISLYSLLILFIGCHDQLNKREEVNSLEVGGSFENAEYLYQNMPRDIKSVDTSPGWKEPGIKLLVTGIVYKKDSKTPAPGIIIYYYQTNKDGRYQHKAGEPRSMPPNSKGQTHGNIRGWVKTDSNGSYSIYTIRPGAYPGFDDPAHIHITIKEPEINEYYIDDFVFDDDKLLVSAKRSKLENRGGSGILRLVSKNGLLVGERDIILGLNIPDYPDSNKRSTGKPTRKSGLQIGEKVSSFIPYHAWGPDKGTRTCPVCKYGWFHGILYFVGNNPDWQDIKKWLLFLEQQSVKRQKYLKVFFVYGNENNYENEHRRKELVQIGKELNIKNTALTYLPSIQDKESEINLNVLNPESGNSFLVYKRRKLIGKFENFRANKENFNEMIALLNNSTNEYFKLNN
jgi:protocatechuate 3,4-dioxygenase beta subunit